MWDLALIRFWRAISQPPATAFGKKVRGRSGFELEGAVDLRTSTFISGWVRDAAKPDDRLRVVARTKNRILGAAIADQHRADLEAAGIGDGRHAFEVHFPECDVDHVFVETDETRQIVPVGAHAAMDATPVHRGEDGWLFLRTGANQVERFFTEPDYFTEAEIERWAILLRERDQRLKQKGIAYFHMIAPDKISVYSDRYGSYLPHFDARPSSALPRALQRMGLEGPYIDLSPELIAERDKALLYWKTDTHWTLTGALIAAREICRVLRLQPPAFSKRLFVTSDTICDLGGKLEPPITEEVNVFELMPPPEFVYANCLVVEAAIPGRSRAGLLHGSHVIYRNENAPNNLTLALFGDSFCEVGPWLLTGAMAQVFREVHFMWSNSIDFGYIAEIKPDVVLSEIAERFVKRLPDDERDLRSFALTRHAEYLTKHPSV